MHPSSPPYCSPVTPACLRNPLQFRPANSSPLAESPSASSPVLEAQARRRSQYKARSPQTPTTTSRKISGTYDGNKLPNSRSSVSVGTPENPPKLSMRDKFRARCLERAVKARETSRAKAIKGKRYGALLPSSDDQPMDDDESEGEEQIMKDELFRRIMENANRRQRHSYRVSYEHDVGSSFDPSLHDAEVWEQELAAPLGPSTRTGVSTRARIPLTPTRREDFDPFDFDEAELEEYVEEYARMTALAEFEDLPEEELFGWSDIEESRGVPARPVNERDTMDLS